MPCYRYRFQHLEMPFSPLCSVLTTVLPCEVVDLCFRYAFQMDSLEAHHDAVGLLHGELRTLEDVIRKNNRQHAMWRNCTRHGVSWEDSMHKTTMHLLTRARDFIKRAVRYMPDPVRVVYRTPVTVVNQAPVLPEMVNYL